VTAFTRPIAGILQTLRLWRRRVRERQALANQLADDVTVADAHHERNTTFWYLPPPC
jgi:uncharacterized protein YjiS (DUF1127 family)